MATETQLDVFKDLDAALADPERVGVLELFRIGKTSLPAEIGLLTRMHTLKVYDCGLDDLPPEIRLCTALEHLDLAGNKLAHIPVYLCALPGLRTLLLQKNKLTEVPPEIGHLRGLEELDLNGNDLRTLPPHAGCLESLTRLDLSENPFEALPAEIGALAKLNSLKLAGGKLTRLPAEIIYCAALEELDLTGNRLAELPAMLGKLSALRSLGLAGNSFEHLPAEIVELGMLRQLGLGRNKLAELPADLGKLARLEQLEAAGNGLTSLPEALASCALLQKLELAENKLAEIPAALAQLARLNHLDLRKNPLARVPKEWGQAPGPLSIDLRGCPPVPLPEELFASGAVQVRRDGNLLPYFNEGLGNYNGKPAPSVRLRRMWTEGDRVIVRVWPEADGLAEWPDWELVWAAQKDKTVLLALQEEAPVPADPKVAPGAEPPPRRQYLAHVAGKHQLTVVPEDQRRAAEAFMQARYDPSGVKVAALAGGSLSERGSLDWINAGIAERGLASTLKLGGADVPEGAYAAVAGVHRAGPRDLRVTLALGEATGEFKVVFVAGEDPRLALGLRPAAGTPNPDEPPARILVQASRRGIKALEEKDFKPIAQKLVQRLEAAKPRMFVDLSEADPEALDRALALLHKAHLRTKEAPAFQAPYLMTRPFDPETGVERVAVAEAGAALRLARVWREGPRLYLALAKAGETPFVPEGVRGWDLWVERVLAAEGTPALGLVLRHRPKFARAQHDPRMLLKVETLEKAQVLTPDEWPAWEDAFFEALALPAMPPQDSAAKLQALPTASGPARCELRLAEEPPAPARAATQSSVQAALPKDALGASPKPAKIEQDEPFRPYHMVGERLSGGVLKRFLSAGVFSAVFEAERPEGRARQVLKVARPPGAKLEFSRPAGSEAAPDPQSSATQARTQARAIHLGGTQELEIDPRALLYRQALRLHAVTDAALVKAGRFIDDGRFGQLELDFVEGQTLRQRMPRGKPAPLGPVLETLRALDRLSRHPAFPYHGDLKPDNVMLAGDRVVLLDPGYFGHLETTSGFLMTEAMVTTPEYYPHLFPDDLLAMG
ncbi:MAG: serine/threonine-protein kinase, partial [Planctomycetota bacterium]|nr:serine/threonine-protein kinase [Planctomycetota bacterium]